VRARRTARRLGLLLFFEVLSARAEQTDEGAGAASTEPSTRAAVADGRAFAEVNGYVDERLSASLVDPFGPLSTRDVPTFLELAEANLQVRVDLGSKRFFAYADVSLFYQAGWLFFDASAQGARVGVPQHDVPALWPFVVPSELYLSLSPAPWLNVLVGKKRITWGSGFAFNPMDLINPPKDPTDPNAQRAGSWLVRVEAPLERLTFSVLFAPQALSTQQGIPTALLTYPAFPPAQGLDTRDASPHYLLAARLYWLWADADWNLVYDFSNKYQNDFTNKSQLGLSFSRYFFTDYEVHLEALLSQGSARSFPSHACATGATRCDAAAAFAATLLGSRAFLPRVLVGARRQFADESLVSLEYYFQGDGYSGPQFADAIALLSSARSQALSLGQTDASALPQRFSFDPLRRHYLIASYSRPRIFDDWTAGAVLIAGLEDLSGVVAPSVTWSAKAWLALSLYGFIPVRGLGVGEAKVGGRSFSEYALAPFDFRMMLEVRAFY
jgi:hypothetical protein